MVRITDNETRQREILKATIELYLDTAQPVSSEALIERYRFNVSSATIRNALKDLEDAGYLTHPHTSAGRIPTDFGYRFYINYLMKETELVKEEKDTLEKFINSYLVTEEEILDSVSDMISHFTHYVGIANYADSHKISYKGLRFLLEQPEFQDIETIQTIFTALEEDRLLDLMNKEMAGHIEVKIGRECDCLGLDYCSLIISECSKSGRRKGKIAVLGPKRMAYQRVIPMVNYLSQLISGEADY